MSADLHLYALPNTEATRQAILEWEAITSAIYIADGTDVLLDEEEVARGAVTSNEYDRRAMALFGDGKYAWARENIWIGQVSWIKVWLDEDGQNRWVPDSVRDIQLLTAGGIVLTRGVAKQIMVALNKPDRSHFGTRHFEYGPIDKLPIGREVRYYRGKSDIFAASYRTRGLAKRRSVKRFLEANIGCILYPESL